MKQLHVGIVHKLLSNILLVSVQLLSKSFVGVNWGSHEIILTTFSSSSKPNRLGYVWLHVKTVVKAVNPKREWHDGQMQIMGTKNYIGKIQPFTWCCVKRACVSVTRRSVLDDSSRVLIGEAGLWRCDWCRRNVGALIGQSACRLLACARAAIDSTRAGASGGLQAATTRPPLLKPNNFQVTKVVIGWQRALNECFLMQGVETGGNLQQPTATDELNPLTKSSEIGLGLTA